ncbi:MAG: hypothetical protein ACMUEL_03750 [Flavobacteriales bacterium Tduv]
MSQNLALLRKDLIHGIMECVAYNINKKHQT